MTDTETIIETKSGKVQGSLEDGLYVFRGIPYAAPPVGELRWRPPQPVRPWSGVLPALKFGPIALQKSSPFSIVGKSEREEPQDESCLYLSVWTPGLSENPRPVMVWIHGGFFTRGSGSDEMTPGAVLPKRGGVVFVSINYRLGPLGFIKLDKATGGEIPAAGSEGLLDQIAALEWVRENIAVFGGDPDNVTVFGESAGAMSIGCLMSMPAAKGLFQKAILQSGASTCRLLDEAAAIGKRYRELMVSKLPDGESLMSVSAEWLVNGQPTLHEFKADGHLDGNRGALMQPVVDGSRLPDIPLAQMQKGSASDISVLVGSNLDEARLFAMMNQYIMKLDDARLPKRLERLLPPEQVAPLVEKYRQLLPLRGRPVMPADIYLAIQTDLQFRIPGLRVVEIQQCIGTPAYSYLFTRESPVPELGACHALDIGFVFGNLSPEFHGSDPAAEKLSRRMQDAWIAFACTGNPSCETLGEWPVYGNDRRTMVLNDDCRVEDAPYEAERRAWDGIPDSLLG